VNLPLPKLTAVLGLWLGPKFNERIGLSPSEDHVWNHAGRIHIPPHPLSCEFLPA